MAAKGTTASTWFWFCQYVVFVILKKSKKSFKKYNEIDNLTKILTN